MPAGKSLLDSLRTSRDLSEQGRPVLVHGTSAFMATSTTSFRQTVFGRNYQFSGQTLPMIKLSFKSKKNNNVNLSYKTTSFRDKYGEDFFRELPVFGQR